MGSGIRDPAESEPELRRRYRVANDRTYSFPDGSVARMLPSAFEMNGMDDPPDVIAAIR